MGVQVIKLVYYTRLFTCTLIFCVNGNNVFIVFLLLLKKIGTIKYTGLVEVIAENDRGQKKSAGYKQTFRRISERLNFQWGGLK